ncbi:hypothetical protein CFP56_043804 [Quercus suber]|uniref:Uncharacterized protein n=1 Tax=Quercus suber TaxID=58331 RepID=A0AAW0LHR5_QUESU
MTGVCPNSGMAAMTARDVDMEVDKMEDVESTGCKHAREVWESSKLALPLVIDQSWTFLDIVQNFKNWEVTQPGLLEKVISVCWGIWKD